MFSNLPVSGIQGQTEILLSPKPQTFPSGVNSNHQRATNTVVYDWFPLIRTRPIGTTNEAHQIHNKQVDNKQTNEAHQIQNKHVDNKQQPAQSEYGDEQADAGRDCRTRLVRPNSQAPTRTGKYSFSLFS